MKVIVAVAQYDVPESVKESIDKLNEVAKVASSKNVQLLVATETAIGMLADVKNVSIDYLPNLQEIAANHNIAIATSFYTKHTDKFFNQGYIVSKDGDIIHEYRKMYLAPPEREQDGISPGTDITVSQSEYGKLGMIICKDGFNKYSHFLYEKFYELGTEILCIPTWSLGWDEMDTQEYVKGLYVYAAFASRSFVLASGNLNKSTKSFGRSLIISPIRGVVKEGSADKEELLIEEIDIDEVKKAREFDSWWQPKERII